ncbi:MAG: hypothetical protein A2184_04420 [Candidatus Moranbacteria bacterium RIFOXYA1_FULL_44_7]|uniref:Uncharacterized protein n=1 Tax=Candidatus Amesbacteria bacterium RIFOXYB1_FULL_44_23 TaxID=1797263 RepID=A0A1F4ZUH5_9BACT|nr:MAG: hypothetical protein A2397_01065 [Candidatus Amesbacteria bacterium RIFOXYB1_FULL_44_23]OGI26600.1 MAG: hypothetical protein A2184_04420 [Candidatus Moranbacteria bacterium RIFOXYA1_FULL_44_7]
MKRNIVTAVLLSTVSILGLSGVGNFLLKKQESSPTIFPDLVTARLATLCTIKNYDAIALSSLRRTGEKYEKITPAILSDSKKNALDDYSIKAQELCKAAANSKRTDKKQVSDSWLIYYNFSLDLPSKVGYEIHHFQGQWQLVLPNRGLAL